MAENGVKKVDYKVISNQRCSICGHPLKQNKVDRKHQFCYVCFKLKNGQRYYFKKGVRFDRLELQKANKRDYLLN